jgi:hyperosmotically inducible protein
LPPSLGYGRHKLRVNNIFANSEKIKAVKVGDCVSSVPPLSAEQLIYMKRITLSLFCLSFFTLSAIAQDTSAADNTRKNERDRSGETMTSGDQSNSKEDVKITAAIRRAVVGDNSLSMTAKNVKIITANGTVTLRGPVKNDAEKAKIAELAQSAAGNTKIDNQLEVKTSE